MAIAQLPFPVRHFFYCPGPTIRGLIKKRPVSAVNPLFFQLPAIGFGFGGGGKPSGHQPIIQDVVYLDGRNKSRHSRGFQLGQTAVGVSLDRKGTQVDGEFESGVPRIPGFRLFRLRGLWPAFRLFNGSTGDPGLVGGGRRAGYGRRRWFFRPSRPAYGPRRIVRWNWPPAMNS